MAKYFKPNQVINGTWGEVWVDDDYMAQVIGLEAKMKLNKSEVSQVQTLAKGEKVTGIEGTGTLKMNKISSYFVVKLLKSIKEGKPVTSKIISNLDDPSVDGNERVLISGVQFDEVTIADWEAKKLLEESIPFTFTDAEIIDSIKD